MSEFQFIVESDPDSPTEKVSKSVSHPQPSSKEIGLKRQKKLSAEHQFVLEGLSSSFEDDDEESERVKKVNDRFISSDSAKENNAKRSTDKVLLENIITTQAEQQVISEAGSSPQESKRSDFYLSEDSDDDEEEQQQFNSNNGFSAATHGGGSGGIVSYGNSSNKLLSWTELQVFMEDTGRFLQCERQQVEKLVGEAENEYKEHVRGHLLYREQISRIRDFPLDAQQPYLPLSSVSQHTLFRSDNAIKVNLGMAKDHITDLLLYLKRNPTLFAASLSGQASLHGIDLVEFIENIWNLFFASPLETSQHKYELNPIFKFLAEVLKREILEQKRLEDVLRTDSMNVKFIQGFMKMTHFQVFISDAFSAPLAAIIRIKKILRIDPSKISDEDLFRGLPTSNRVGGEATATKVSRTSEGSSTASSEVQNTLKKVSAAKTELSFLSSFKNLFTSQDKKKKQLESQERTRSAEQQDMFGGLGTGSLDASGLLGELSKSANPQDYTRNQSSILPSQSSSSLLNTAPQLFQNDQVAALGSLMDQLNYQNSSEEGVLPGLQLESSQSGEGYSVDSMQQPNHPVGMNVTAFNAQDAKELENLRNIQAEKNQRIVEEITAQIIDALTKHVSCIPKGIKIMCKMIMRLLGQREKANLSESEKHAMLSQFLIMRWVVPQFVGLLHCKTSMELHTLHCQNISIVTKVLQKTFKKEYENFADNPSMARFTPFMRSYAERIDTFFHYLLNFEGQFIDTILDSTDAVLFPQQTKSILSLCVSFSDIYRILKMFSGNTDATLKAQHSIFYQYVERSVHINDSENFLDGSKQQEMNMLYIWKPAEYVTQSFVEKCMVFEVKEKGNVVHMERVRIMNTLISLLRRIHPREEMIERRSNAEDHDLLAILKFYAAQNRLRSKLSTHGVSTKIRANVLLEALMKGGHLSAAYSEELLTELYGFVSKNRREIMDSIKSIKCSLHQALARTKASTFKMVRETQQMKSRSLKQNVIVFIKSADVFMKVVYNNNSGEISQSGQFTLIPWSAMIMQQQQAEAAQQLLLSSQAKENTDFISRSLIRLKGQSSKKREQTITQNTPAKQNDNEVICRNVKELMVELNSKQILDHLICSDVVASVDSNNAQQISQQSFCEDLSWLKTQLVTFTNEMVDQFFGLPVLRQCSRSLLEDDVAIEFQKYISRWILKKLLKKHMKLGMSADSKVVSTKNAAAKKSYDSILFQSLSAKMQKISSSSNHIDMLAVIEQCVSELKDIAELEGLNAVDNESIAVRVAQVLESSSTTSIAPSICRIIECLITEQYWSKHSNEKNAFDIFRLSISLSSPPSVSNLPLIQ